MKEYNCIIGIDFGVNGGIAINADGRTVVSKMPKDISAIGEFLQFYKETYNPICFVEKLSIRTDDLTGGKVFRIRKMIANQEGIKAIISLAGVDFCEVHPLTWQSRLGLRIVGEEKPVRKRRYKEVAQNLYPQCDVTMANCDALLIMRFGIDILQSDKKKDKKWLSDNIAISKRNVIF